MSLAVALLGLCMLALGIAGVLSPPRVIVTVARLGSQAGIYFLAGLRLLLGAAMLFAAPESRWPAYLQALGALSLISGLATPFFGLRTFLAVLDWWRRRPPLLVRVWSAGVALFGLSLVWVVFPGLSAA